jgi:Protein of unknown function (DUF4007)
MKQFRFSGHETFSCRTFWPKKGFDFVLADNKFNQENASSILGVGKNMVASIQFWMKSMNLLDDEGSLTEFAKSIFGDDGYDPFLEDVGTIWLLHSELVVKEHASLYSLFFNDFRTQKSSFSKQLLLNYIRAEYKRSDHNGFNPATVEKDISVFCRSYNQPDYKNTKKNFEDEISSLLLELELMRSTKIRDTNNKVIEWYNIESNERYNLDSDIILYFILNKYQNKQTIPFRNLLTDNNSPAKVFCLNRDGLYRKLKEQEIKRDGLFISETAGNVVLNLPLGLNSEEVLNNYYGN